MKSLLIIMEKKLKKTLIRLQWPQNPHHCNTYIRVVASAVYGENASVLSVNIGKVYFMGVFVP